MNRIKLRGKVKAFYTKSNNKKITQSAAKPQKRNVQRLLKNFIRYKGIEKVRFSLREEDIVYSLKKFKAALRRK